MEVESAMIGDALSRALRVLRIGGVAPLSFSSRHAVTIVRVWSGLLYYGYFLSTILNVAVLTILVALITLRGEKYHYRSTVAVVIEFSILTTTSVIISKVAYGARKRMNYLLQLLRQLRKITILIPEESIIVEDRKRTLKTTVGMILVLASYVIEFGASLITCISLNSTMEEVVEKILYSATYVQGAIVVIITVQIVLVISTMRKAVESFIWELKRQLHIIEKGQHRDVATLFKMKERMWRVGRYYLSLCENVRAMNNHEGALMLLLVVFYVLQIMNNSYRIILTLNPENSSVLKVWNRYLITAAQPFMITLHIVMLGILVNTCDKIQTEVQKLRALASEVMYRGREVGDKFSTAAGVLCEQVSMYQPIFKPLNICALTRSLFVTVISGVITYLVTVVKFHDMEAKSHKE